MSGSIKKSNNVRPDPSPLAAIDIGSNTIHLLVASPKPGGHWDIVNHDTDMASLGTHLAREDCLPPKLLRSLEKTLKRQIRKAHKAGAHAVMIGATEVMRRAPHGESILKQLEQKTGVPVHLLSPQREAQLGFLGARPHLHPTDSELLIDSGGGSTELTLTRNRQRMAWISLPIGSGILSAEFHHDPPQPLEWIQLLLPIQAALTKAPVEPHPHRALAIGGSAHFLSKLVHGHKDGPLDESDLNKAALLLLDHSSKKIARKRNMHPERARVMPVGLLIMSQILRHYGLSRMEVTRAGIREGMLQAYLDKGTNWWKED